MSNESDNPATEDEIPEMSAAERENSSLILLMLLAQAYYKMLESAVSMSDWVTQLDLELNSSYLWVTDNLINILKNTPELSDFPSKFEPAFPDLYPRTIADAEWEWVRPNAEDFLSAVQRYVHTKKTFEPEENTPGWILVEMFRPGVDTAIERAQTYHKRMTGHVKTMMGVNEKKPAAPENMKPDDNAAPQSGTQVKEERTPPMESGDVTERTVYIDGEKYLLPSLLIGPRGPVTLQQLTRVAKDLQIHVLITGESGTGKESLARFVRDVSGMSVEKWGAVNCASLTPDLADSELFGHVKGAFTGADEMRQGLLSTNSGGAVFLDEIGALPEATQRKLLRFLDSYELRPVGADRDKKVITRIVAATNADVEAALVHDLLPRFAFQVGLPPLRQRLGDIPWLLGDSRFLGDGRTFTGISLRTLCALFVHEYPKNMRDLYNLCRDWLYRFPPSVYVLDDFSIMGREEKVWVRFAAFTLAALEKHTADTGIEAFKDDGRVEICALLLDIMTGEALAFRICDLSELVGPAGRIFNTQVLHDALCAASPDFRHSAPKKNSESVVSMCDAVVLLKGWVQIYKKLAQPSRVELVGGKRMSSLGQRYKEPGSAFVDGLRDSISKIWRWAEPELPAEPELEKILDEKCIAGELRRVCMYCAEGLSIPKIVNQPDISKKRSWIQEELDKLRSDERLSRLLPVAGPGRKRTK